MTIKQIHEIILFYLKKDRQAFVTHEEIDSVLDRAQLALFNKYHSNPKIYTVPGGQGGFGYGDSQRIDDALSPFKELYTFNNAATPGGVVTLPSNYMHMISVSTTQFVSSLNRNVYSAVQVLNEEELIERLESQVVPVSFDDPVCIMSANKRIQLFPEQPQSGRIYYFRRPTPPVLLYTITGRSITYNEAGSTNLEWNHADINNVIIEALSYYGLNLNSAEIIQFAQLKNEEGQ